MAYRWHPKNAEVDADSPRAWGVCDRCGFVWNLHKMQFQYAYQGSTQPQNTNFVVCDRCLDPLDPQSMPYILPPDPMPVYNARPEPYTLDETSWMSTPEGDILTTEDDEQFITPLPNPATPAVANENSIVEEASVEITTEDGETIVTEEGDGNPLNIDPNPGNSYPP